MNAGALRILLVDDHAILRRGLRLLLEKLPGVAAVSDAARCPSPSELSAAALPDLIILDVHLPEMNGITGARGILSAHPGIKIIMLSGDASLPLVLDALRAGASAYVTKENSPEELARAIQAVVAGNAYFSPEVAAVIASHLREEPPAGPPDYAKPLLSDREKWLLQLIAEGKRNKEIAVALKVTTKSIEAYRSRLMAKLNCSSPAELTRFAVREGIAAL